MAPRPSAPSPQARRQAQLLGLQAALASRNAQLMSQLLAQWVHRHGVSSLPSLWAELSAVEPEGCAWWHEHSNTAAQPEPAPLIEALPAEPAASTPAVRPLRLAPPVPTATRPAPAPTHPALVQLRAWLPDQESRRSA